MDRRVDGHVEGPTLFHRTLLATSGCPTGETTKEISDQTFLNTARAICWK